MADRGVRRRGRGFGARGGFKRTHNTHSEPEDDFEGPEIKQLREKHGESVSLVQAVFPDWDEVSVLYALAEAGGSVELAISRIVEGQAEQWGSVKPKKQQQKKETSTAETAVDGQGSSIGAAARGSFGGRGRGRGEFRGGRGGFRGAARGGRGGAVAGRQPSNGQITVTEVTDVAADADGTVTTTTVTEAEGEGVTEVSVEETSTDVEGTTVQVQESVAVVEKPQPPTKPTNGWAQKGKGPASSQAPSVAAAPKQAAQPAAKLSWAQIARPPPPKVQPAPVPKAAPVQQAPAPVEPAVVVAEISTEESEPVIVIAELEAAEPEAAQTAPQDPWSSTPAAAVLSGDSQQPTETEALPVGEAWADSIIAKNDYVQSQQTSAEQEEQHQRAQAAAPPAGVNPAGALDVHTPAANEVPSQQLPTQSERISAPPGLSKRASAVRGKQDAPVVMPGSTPDIERIGVQFGSLNMFGSIPTESAAEEQQPQQQVQQSLYETPAVQQHQDEYQQPPQSLQDLAAQQAPAPYDIQQQAQAQYYQSQAQKQAPQYGGVFDRLGSQQQQQHYQQPQQQQQQAPASAYSSRYQPFGQSAQQQQPQAQDPFASITSPYLQNVARAGSAQQQSSVPSLAGADSISPYYSSQQAQNLQTHQGTQTQAQQPAVSPIPNARESAGSVPPQQSAYGGFTSAIGQATQGQQPQQQQQGYPSDYSSYYGMQDQTRNLQSYYGQSEQPAQQQQYRASATDDLTAKLGASSTTAAPGLAAQQQQQLGQQQQHYNPNMMGGYNYPYYPYGGYGNPSYGNPNYSAYPPQAPYNYGAYGGQNRNAYQGGAGANHSHQNSTGAASNSYSRTSGLTGYGSNAYGSFDTSSRGLSQGGSAQSGVQGLAQGQQDRSGSNSDAFVDPRYSSNY